MYRVATIKVTERSGENVSFTCDSYDEYTTFYSFFFGAKDYLWCHNIDRILIKSIEKL